MNFSAPAARIPAWLQSLEDQLCHHGPADVDTVRDALARARVQTINGSPDRPWNGSAFIWLQGLENKRASDALVEEVLQTLLAKGLDANVSGKPSNIPKDAMAVYRIHCAPPTERKRQYVGVMTSPNADPWAREGDLLTRVCWAGRHRPNLVALVRALITAGANPHASYNGRGPWNVVAATGDVEVMKELAQNTPSGFRPPHYAKVLLNGLFKDTLSSSGGAVDDACRKAGLEWLLSTYPPTQAEIQEVFQALLPNPMREPEALVRWLLLPASGLAHPGKLPNAPKGFNPWVVAGVMEGNLDEAKKFLETLANHSWWGQPEQVRACRLTSVNRTGLAFIDAHAVKTSLMDAWLVEGQDSDKNERTRAFRRYLFEIAQRLGVQPTPVLPSLLARLYGKPDAAAAAWLTGHRETWAPCASTGATPWHHVPRRESFVQWMDDVDVPCNTVNEHGEHGFASYVVNLIVEQNQDRLKWCQERFKRGGIDLEGRARGQSMRGWMSSHKDLVRLLPKGAAIFDHNTLAATLTGLSLPAIRKVWEKGARFGSTPADQSGVLQAWAFGGPVGSSGGSYSDAILTKRASAMHVLGKATEHGLSEQAYNRVFEYAHAQSRSGDMRPDLRAYWEFMHNVPESAWGFRDLAAVSKWFLVEIKAHCKQVAQGDRLDNERPWQRPTWSSWSPQLRGRVLRGVLIWMGHKRHQDSNSLLGASHWLLDQAQDHRNDFWHGIAPAAAARIAAGLHDQAGRLESTPLSKWAKATAASIAREALLAKSLPEHPDFNSTAPRLRF